jgi:hypothetical protein
MGLFSRKSDNEKELDSLNLHRDQQTALNDGTPITVIHSNGDGKVVVANDLTDLCKEVDRSEIAEPEHKKSGWF